ncbi:MAG: 4Fe-4S binding protein [Anaerolineae bacterium]|nr:4Fe-4S binding protein [Anaerolineae bacterium]
MKRISKRQFVRRAIIFAAFLLFPLFYNFLSPYLIINGAFEGVVNGSALTFSVLFLSSLLVGRAWCAWACPAGGLAEACIYYVRDKKTGQKGNWIKWAIWIPWMGLIIAGFVTAGGIHSVNPIHLVGSVISAKDLPSYIIYYFVAGTIFVLSLTAGNRAFCHYACWMAPFMIIGRKLRNLAKYPSLRLVVEPEKCTDCKQCVRSCPMSLDVNELVARGDMEHSECILCGNCVDTCHQGVIRYSFSKG